MSNLIDGPKTTIKCPNCKNVELANIWITRQTDEKWKVQCVCCFCNQKSFIHEFKGGIHYGPTKDAQHPDIDFDQSKNFLTIYTIAGNPNYEE